MKRHVERCLLDIAGAAEFLGMSPRALRARIARQQVPYRKLGGRIVLVKAELEDFLSRLDGVAVDVAVRNVSRDGHDE